MNLKYKIGIIGAGSIGRRHLRNIVEVLSSRNISFEIDLIRSGTGNPITSEEAAYICNTYLSYDDIPDDYDILFITNPTHLHYETIIKYSNKTKHMFIEKPVFDQSDIDIRDLGLKKNGVYYVACPLRYTEVIQYLKKELHNLKIYSARAICSSYLPDWRPNQDYRECYSAHKDQGGGVSIDLIHEWDYISYLFGHPESVFNIRDHFSDLEIDSDDLSIYIARYPHMAVELHLDYFGRKTIREICIFTESDTIIGDITNSEVRYLKKEETISFKEKRNDFYLKEMEHFYDILAGVEKNDNDILTALHTLRLTKEGK